MDHGSGTDKNSSDKWSPLDQDWSISLILEVLPCSPTKEPRALSQGLRLVHTTQVVDDPAAFKMPKMDVPTLEGKKQTPWTHNLRPYALNTFMLIAF